MAEAHLGQLRDRRALLPAMYARRYSGLSDTEVTMGAINYPDRIRPEPWNEGKLIGQKPPLKSLVSVCNPVGASV